MALLGIDIGGTKMAIAIFDEQGKILFRETILWSQFIGREVGDIICLKLIEILADESFGAIDSVGICVPGIYRS